MDNSGGCVEYVTKNNRIKITIFTKQIVQKRKCQLSYHWNKGKVVTFHSILGLVVVSTNFTH